MYVWLTQSLGVSIAKGGESSPILPTYSPSNLKDFLVWYKLETYILYLLHFRESNSVFNYVNHFPKKKRKNNLQQDIFHIKMMLGIKKYSLLFVLLSLYVMTDLSAFTVKNLGIVGDQTQAKGQKSVCFQCVCLCVVCVFSLYVCV